MNELINETVVGYVRAGKCHTFLEGEMFRRLLEAFLLPQGSLLQRHAMKIEEILANFQM